MSTESSFLPEPSKAVQSVVNCNAGCLTVSIYIPSPFTASVSAGSFGSLIVTAQAWDESQAAALADGLRLASMQVEHAERRRRRLEAILREGLTPCDAGVQA